MHPAGISDEAKKMISLYIDKGAEAMAQIICAEQQRIQDGGLAPMAISIDTLMGLYKEKFYGDTK